MDLGQAPLLIVFVLFPLVVGAAGVALLRAAWRYAKQAGGDMGTLRRVAVFLGGLAGAGFVLAGVLGIITILISMFQR